MASAAANAAWESSPEFAAWKAKQQVVAESKSAADAAESGRAAAAPEKKQRKKRAAKTESVAEVADAAPKAAPPAAKKKRQQQVVAPATGDETDPKNMGGARKIRQRGKKDNALDKIPSSNRPPKTDAENAAAQAQVNIFTDMMMKAIANTAAKLRKEEKDRGLPPMSDTATQVMVFEPKASDRTDDESEDDEDGEGDDDAVMQYYGKLQDFSGIDLRPYMQ
jgi:hypothetical protein